MYQAESHAREDVGSSIGQSYEIERTLPIWGEVARSAKSSYQLPDLFITDNIVEAKTSAESGRAEDTDFLLAQELVSDLVIPRHFRS